MAKVLENITTVDPVSVLGSIHIQPDTLKEKVLKLSNTSQMIRYLYNHFQQEKDDRLRSTKMTYHKLKEYNVTTKHGGEIRYQHVRNIILTPVIK